MRRANAGGGRRLGIARQCIARGQQDRHDIRCSALQRRVNIPRTVLPGNDGQHVPLLQCLSDARDRRRRLRIRHALSHSHPRGSAHSAMQHPLKPTAAGNAVRAPRKHVVQPALPPNIRWVSQRLMGRTRNKYAFSGPPGRSSEAMPLSTRTSRGRPSTRSAMMFRRISSVPPCNPKARGPHIGTGEKRPGEGAISGSEMMPKMTLCLDGGVGDDPGDAVGVEQLADGIFRPGRSDPSRAPSSRDDPARARYSFRRRHTTLRAFHERLILAAASPCRTETAYWRASSRFLRTPGPADPPTARRSFISVTSATFEAIADLAQAL